MRHARVAGESLIDGKDRNLNQGLIEELLTGRWIQSDNPPNVVVTGAAGTGKTYLVEALGKSATQKGITVTYWRFPQLLEKMTEAFNRNESNALRRRINFRRLLSIDDFAGSFAGVLYRDSWDFRVKMVKNLTQGKEFQEPPCSTRPLTGYLKRRLFAMFLPTNCPLNNPNPDSSQTNHTVPVSQSH